jgi:hypothetical protein
MIEVLVPYKKHSSNVRERLCVAVSGYYTGSAKLLNDFFTSYFELEMHHDIKIN